MFDDEILASPSGQSAVDSTIEGTRVKVHGHLALVDALLVATSSGRAGPPMLLAGPVGVGKKTLSLLAAQSIVCEAEPSNVRPCGACRACRLVASSGHPDVFVLESPLRIEAARRLQAALALAPVEGRAHVAIIPEIETASLGAANSLLKTLEEPPSHAVIILTTAAESTVLPTIRSRCRRVAVRPLSFADATEALVLENGLDRSTAERAARLGGGCLGECMKWVEERALEDRDGWLNAAFEVVASERVGRVDLATRLAKAGDGLEQGLRLWLGFWRDALLVHFGAEDSVVNIDRLNELRDLASSMEPRSIAAAARAIETALVQLSAHAAPLAVLEVLMLGLPAGSGGGSRPVTEAN